MNCDAGNFAHNARLEAISQRGCDPLTSHRALDVGRVGLATLDCVEPEPLPAGHWLYDHPKVRLTPHISWAGPESHEGLMDRFVENLERFLRGEALEYRVDPDERY